VWSECEYVAVSSAALSNHQGRKGPTIKVETDSEVELDWSSHEEEHTNPNLNTDETEEINLEHVELGRQVAKLALAKGGLSTREDFSDAWVIRRMGYSYEANPDGVAMILSTDRPLGTIYFDVDRERGRNSNKRKPYIPTYNVKNALEGLLEGQGMGHRLAQTINPDELAVVRPLEQVLKQCFEEQGGTVPSVLWYPPPSEEETTYASTFGGP
jgi:hypothetical protein